MLSALFRPKSTTITSGTLVVPCPSYTAIHNIWVFDSYTSGAKELFKIGINDNDIGLVLEVKKMRGTHHWKHAVNVLFGVRTGWLNIDVLKPAP